MDDYTHWHPTDMQDFPREEGDQKSESSVTRLDSTGPPPLSFTNRNGSPTVQASFTAENSWAFEVASAAWAPAGYRIFPSGLHDNSHSRYSYDSLAHGPIRSPGDSFTFESGARIIEGPEEHSRSISDVQITKGDRFVCLHIGCKSKRTFGRVAELQRHIRKHFPEELFECPIESCKYKGVKAFYRFDKYIHHIRKDHEFEKFTCPVGGCYFSHTRAELEKHIGSHPWRSRLSCHDEISRLGFSWFNYVCRCPIEGCGDAILGDRILISDHIARHPLELRMKSSSMIAQLDYNWRYALYTCPIDGCGTEHKGRGGFSRHLREHQSGLPECMDALERLGFKPYFCPLLGCDAAHFGTYNMSGHLSGHRFTEVFAHKDDLVIQDFVIHKCPMSLCGFTCFQAQTDDEPMQKHISEKHDITLWGKDSRPDHGLNRWSNGPLDEVRHVTL
ncbi:hypothetical protein GP486_000752 [Trichoglossum hirsutum]|uniref:C2H2-type domain-containing protein n=1 Tax=Trichoglossum hirsutum TaxID=265104 RepID=A0A9P8LH82_9PEZI|nr:hypothetical protein GP486_000752 [Trichoglossum hirsutum]